jgi:DNA-binding transcriptional LysR family regulator
MQSLSLATVDLNLLVVFDTIMTERSVSRAAERLHLTQSAVSHALTRLRALMEDELFIRVAAGMLPTALAESISGRVRAALREIQGVLTRENSFDPSTSTHRFTLCICRPLPAGCGNLPRRYAWSCCRPAGASVLA